MEPAARPELSSVSVSRAADEGSGAVDGDDADFVV
jgi:hypothetical protein